MINLKINAILKKYIDDFIFPSYVNNDSGHNIDHINYVINRSLKFAQDILDVNIDMVYTIAAYHDVGHYIDYKNHEKISAEILEQDENLKMFFSDDEIKIMSDAVFDHRASLEYEPKTIYGKIISSADRNTIVDDILKRTYDYRIKHNLDFSIDELINESRNHIIDKFGKSGYAKDKMYFKDEEYEKFLKEIDILMQDEQLFKKRFLEVNKIEVNI